jgi:hypothetical protein
MTHVRKAKFLNYSVAPKDDDDPRAGYVVTAEYDLGWEILSEHSTLNRAKAAMRWYQNHRRESRRP